MKWSIFAHKKFFIIGPGMIGNHLFNCLIERDASVIKYGRKEIENLERDILTFKPQIIFLSLPNKNPKEVTDIFSRIVKLELKIPIVTCEKMLLSSGFQKAFPHIDLVRGNASVGGGNRFISWLKDRINPDEFYRTNAVLNGSLNFIFDELSKRPDSISVILEEAKQKKILEPGARTLDGALKNEIEDMILKACILWNLCFRTEFTLTPEIFWRNTGLDFEKLIETCDFRKNPRFIVQIGKHLHGLEKNIIAHASPELQEVQIVFSENGEKAFGGHIPRGVNNCMYLWKDRYQAKDAYYLEGPGAGPDVTVSSMLTDAEHFLRR
jgi:homoserine dehydrogenase